MRRLRTTSALAFALGLSLAAGARADVYGPISLASVNQLEQADRAEHAAISLDGRYVAFDGSFGGVAGVWRKDLSTGALEAVAVGAENTPAGEAKLPSISEDGRYVSFSTSARLDEKNDVNKGPDVYVRDMNMAAGGPCAAQRNEASEPCPYKLASAVDGSPAGLSYHYGSSPGEEIAFGALAAGRSAMSADGRYVAFVTTAISNLAGAETPPLQVAVRDLRQQHTYLVSALYDPATGAPAIDPETKRDMPVPTALQGRIGAVFDGGAVPRFQFAEPDVGASISADGTTVAWLAQQVGQQAATLPEHDSASEEIHAEPLWRRWQEGPTAPTRRVTGGGDSLNPACEADEHKALESPPSLSNPCQGPFAPNGNGATGIEAASSSDHLPRLSADGDTVAFLASAPLVEGGEFGSTGSFSDDLYVVNMRDPSLSRVAALRRLTAIAAGGSRDFGRVEAIEDLGVSPDGTQIAFATKRTVFPLGSPAYVSAPLPAPAEESGPQELYSVDLANDTLTRVTHGFNGGSTELVHVAENGFAGSPSFSADDGRLAFTSVAPNLVYGDGNRASDVFVVDRETFASNAVLQYISAAPSGPATEPGWMLGARAHSRRDGSVVLEVLVPGAGQLRFAAQSAVLVAIARSAHGSRQRRRSRRSHSQSVVQMRTVAAAARASAGEELLSLRLVLTPHYRTLAQRRGGQSATVTLQFSSPGHRLVRGSISVTFIHPSPPHKRKAKKRTHSRGGHG
jgi:Tol biopolymer transport system component